METEFEHALTRAATEEALAPSDIVALLGAAPGAETAALYRAADAVRRRYVGDGIFIRGLVEFSNHCWRNCMYCGLRRENRQLERFRMSVDEILDCVLRATGLGIRTIVLQSGEDPWWTTERMARLIGLIKERFDVALTLSVGERSFATFRAWREAGADRYLLRHETADPDLYRALHPDSIYEERLRCLSELKLLGYQVGAGSMVGLPGQTVETLAADVAFVRDIDADMVGIGPFIPNPHTPLCDAASGSVEMTLKMIAVTRLMNRNALIPATTALASLDEFGREKAWMAGANIIMPIVTPQGYRQLYAIYPSRRCLDDDITHCYGCLGARILSIGREVGEGYGHSFKRATA